MSILPIVAKEEVFALKGGTAINLFIRDLPRLSVDIDLTYLPVEERQTSLVNMKGALTRISEAINSENRARAIFQQNRDDELRVIIANTDATIKLEVSPVARGAIYTPILKPVTEQVEDLFGYAEIKVVSNADLYGGKICAALDRQHPRDLFDVKLLLENEGINREIFIGFVTYMLSHPRPMHEIMQPNWKSMSEQFSREFDGMTITKVSLTELESTRQELIEALRAQFTQRDADFLLSFKRGSPDWTLFDEPEISKLPAVRWKLRNIDTLCQNEAKHAAQFNLLKAVLKEWLS